MSNDTWLAEFYPKPAADVPADEAVAHSLQKWRGLKKENLGNHDIYYPPVTTNAATCALCQLYYAGELGDDQDPSEKCGKCPLKMVRGAVCDSKLPSERSSPWAHRKTDDGASMIKWLEKAAEYERNEHEEKETESAAPAVQAIARSDQARK